MPQPGALINSEISGWNAAWTLLGRSVISTDLGGSAGVKALKERTRARSTSNWPAASEALRIWSLTVGLGCPLHSFLRCEARHCAAASNEGPQIGRVRLHFGNPGHPQNSCPRFSPRRATRSTIGRSQSGQCGTAGWTEGMAAGVGTTRSSVCGAGQPRLRMAAALGQLMVHRYKPPAIPARIISGTRRVSTSQ